MTFPAHVSALKLSGQWPASDEHGHYSFAMSLPGDVVSGHFSDNAILLLPNEPATITFTPNDPKAKASITVRDPYSATCIQKISGWETTPFQ
ncbi:glycoside hydrolase family 2 protein [Pseudovibrio sp. Tun.PSC04-5.I4]|uniref:glycoside hydrolase family 2 protein n=1 Tax=Pseudovibrio sp. Tun.PSC04-5.I4 TaxID=1798213 RepID=UPI00117BDE37|nr:glycoside hydrolase family 2 protein [Pseudovibrio sp. Tun.PSC04-5.I4]